MAKKEQDTNLGADFQEEEETVVPEEFFEELDDREVVGVVKVTRVDPELGKVVDRHPIFAGEDAAAVEAEIHSYYKDNNAPKEN